MKYFIDTCVWRDFYENRKSFLGRNLGKEAVFLFQKIITEKSMILFSESLIDELKISYSIFEIEQMFDMLSLIGVLKRIEITQNEFTEAKLLSKSRKLPFVDCLNAIQARNHKAIMISQDTHFIEDLADITKTVKPEQIN